MKKKYIEVIQEENSDCGISCLASIIKYYGGNVSLENLRIDTNTSNEGCNAYDLINCAKKYGFNSFGKKINSFQDINLPTIAHVKLENDLYHFVVIYEIKKDYIIIMDPSVGLRKVKIVEFKKVFTNVVIVLVPISELPIHKKTKIINKKIYSYVRDNKRIFFLIIFISILILLLSLIENFEIKILTMNNNYFYILLLLAYSNYLLIFIKEKLLLYSNVKFNNKLINVFLNYVFLLPLNYLKLKQKGELVARFKELDELSNNILNILIGFLFDILLILSILIIIVFYNIYFPLILLLFTILYISFNYFIYKKLVSMIRYSISLEENYSSNIIDCINNITTIKHLRKYDYFKNSINYNLKNKNNLYIKINKSLLRINVINDLFFCLFRLFILYFLINNNYDITNSLLLYIIFNYYIFIIKRLVSYYPSYILFRSIINKNNDFLSINVNKQKLLNLDNINIKIMNLSYSLNNNKIINNLNVYIEKNSHIIINGPSGSGKSTFLKILNKEINNYDGLILFKNIDIKKYDISNIISYTSQDEELFNDTIINNILLGEEVEESFFKDVLKICRLESINTIRKYGLDSFVINNNSLSGGEKNRVILARSLIHSKKIIILDEVLKEVDYDLEVSIVKDMLNYFKDRTIIYVSHKNISNLFSKVLTFRKES